MPKRRHTTHTPRAFTLLELVMSMAIAVIVAAVGISSVSNIVALMSDSRRTLAGDQEAKLLTDFFSTTLQAVGGGTLRPWSSSLVVNNASGTFSGSLVPLDGSDRVVLMEPVPGLPTCTIVSTTATFSEITVALNGGSGAGFDACCLDADPDGNPVDFEGRQAVLSSGNFYMQVELNSNSGACSINSPPGKHAALANTTGATAASWVGGTLTAVRFRTIYVNPSFELRQFSDVNADDVVDPGEDTVLTDRVFDLQIELGYDSPSDGKLVDDGTTNDEWLNNAPGDGLGTLGLAAALPEDLRMIGVGVTVGVPHTRRGANAVQLLDGPARTIPGVMLRGSRTQLMLRNIFIFY